MKSLDEILQFDLRHSAYHEAGHAVMIARYTGNIARCEIFRRTQQGLMEKSVVGRAGFATQNLYEWAESDKATMAMAGEISSLLSDGEDDPFLLEHYLSDVWEGQSVSETDRDAAGENWKQHLSHAVAQCIEFWPMIERVACRLVEEFKSDGQKASVNVYFTKHDKDNQSLENDALIVSIETELG